MAGEESGNSLDNSPDQAKVNIDDWWPVPESTHIPDDNWGIPREPSTDSEDSATESPAATPVPLHKHFKHAVRHSKHDAHHKFHAIAAAPDADKNADTKTVVADATTDVKAVLPEISPSVANANAQMLLAGAQMSAAAR